MPVDPRGGTTVPGVFDSLPFTIPVQYRPVVLEAAAKYGVRPQLLAAQIEAESGFQNLGANAAGATGIAQFTPATALSVGVNPHDPVQSIFGAAKLDAEYITKYGSEELALAAYNAGPNAPGIADGHLPPYKETIAYVARIMGWAGKGASDPSVTADGSTAVPTAVAAPTTAAEVLAKVKSGTAWTRLGKGLAGLILAMIGVWFAFSRTGQTGTLKKGVKKVIEHGA